MKKQFLSVFSILLAATCLLSACAPVGEVTLTPTPTVGVPTETPTPTPEDTPAPTEAPPEKSAFETELAKRLEGSVIDDCEYGSNLFPARSRNQISSTTALFFYCVREQLEQLRDVDFSGFWDPETDPAAPGTYYLIWGPEDPIWNSEDPGSFDDFLAEVRSYRSESSPVGWANVRLGELTGLDIPDITGYEGEIVTGRIYGTISLIYPRENTAWVNWMINHELTFVCRDRRWYICAIRFLGNSPYDQRTERGQ